MMRLMAMFMIVLGSIAGSALVSSGEENPFCGEFQILEKGYQACRQEPGVLVVEGADALLNLYDKELGLAAKPPVIDFERYAVVAVFGGMKTSGGYGIEITRVTYKDKALDVAFVLHAPSKGAMVTQALTSPYEVVLVKKTPKDKSF